MYFMILVFYMFNTSGGAYCYIYSQKRAIIRVTKVDKFRRVYKFPRVDTFPGVIKIIEFVSMMFIWILIIKMCYSWMWFLSF